jgi:hypothetical protein
MSTSAMALPCLFGLNFGCWRLHRRWQWNNVVAIQTGIAKHVWWGFYQMNIIRLWFGADQLSVRYLRRAF